MSDESPFVRRAHPLHALTCDLQLMLDHLFPERRATAPWEPVCDVYETPEAFVVHMELAGVTREDVELRVSDNVVTIQGRRPSAKLPATTIVHRRERRVGRFERSLVLPMTVDADRVEATVEAGVLTLVLPRRQPQRIRIQVSPGEAAEGQEGPASADPSPETSETTEEG